MSVNINLLPEIIPFNNFGNWDVYMDVLYAIFKRDFIDSKPKVGQVLFRLKYQPVFQDRAYTFYHMTHKGNIEDERIPDMRRSERVPWCRPTIENADAYNLCFWEEERKGSGVSPMLANIYLSKLDEFAEHLKKEFSKGKSKDNLEYSRAASKLYYIRRRNRANWENWSEQQRKEALRLQKDAINYKHSLPSKR